ncbi:helix-turn-helix domain-containing protein [Enterobacter kobei]|nr:helix-turn-helix domain-containing protein [Enterobacter kobei]
MVVEIKSAATVRPEMIELRRKMLGMSQKDLAHRVALSQGTLSKIEQGLKSATEDQIRSIAEALNCPVDFFYDVRKALWWTNQCKPDVP